MWLAGALLVVVALEAATPPWSCAITVRRTMAYGTSSGTTSVEYGLHQCVTCDATRSWWAYGTQWWLWLWLSVAREGEGGIGPSTMQPVQAGSVHSPPPLLPPRGLHVKQILHFLRAAIQTDATNWTGG